MSFENDEAFERIVQDMDVSPETVAMGLRHDVITETNAQFAKYYSLNTFALNELAVEQILKFNMPELTFPSARALLKPQTSRIEYGVSGFSELYVYQPYHHNELAKSDGTYDVVFFRPISQTSAHEMVALTPTQTVLFAMGEELIFDTTDGYTKIVGFRIDEDTIDTAIDPYNSDDEVALLEEISRCLERYKPTSQYPLGNGGEDGSRSAA